MTLSQRRISPESHFFRHSLFLLTVRVAFFNFCKNSNCKRAFKFFLRNKNDQERLIFEFEVYERLIYDSTEIKHYIFSTV